MLALECAMIAAGVWGEGGEVITTPYSFVATAHAIRRAGLVPVFIDIRPDDLNIDADLVEAAITPRTRAIVPVHCYGNPCQDARLQALADAHDIPLIYDAAHAFGVRVAGQSLLRAGDFAGVSFHATKVFNSFEGGAVFSRTAAGKRAVDLARNFGIADEVNVASTGVNAKMSELHAAVGLLQLPRLGAAIRARGAVDARYRAALAAVAGIEPLARPAEVKPNFSYFPILVGDDYPLGRDQLYEALKTRGLFSRRYFYPLIANLPLYAGLPSAAPDRLPVANDAAARVLCLPIYPDLSVDEQDRVIEAIVELEQR